MIVEQPAGNLTTLLDVTRTCGRILNFGKKERQVEDQAVVEPEEGPSMRLRVSACISVWLCVSLSLCLSVCLSLSLQP